MTLRELMTEQPDATQSIIDVLVDDCGDDFQFDDQGILWDKVWSVESGAYEAVLFWDASKNQWEEGSWDDSPWCDE